MILMFGKNLKKIRNIHRLSQQEFADIFELKRGTLGAYEEGRSNPKLETVIKIANYFSIGLEDLLISELTVNKLIKFNEALTTQNDLESVINFAGIPCVLPSDRRDFIKNHSTVSNFDKLSVIKLPYIDTHNRIAFAIDDLSMTGGAVEFFPKDVVIGHAIEISAIEDKSLVIVLTESELLLRRIYLDDQNYILRADHHGVSDNLLSSEDLLGVWKIEHVINYEIHSKGVLIENRLATIEQSLASLKTK